MENVLINIYDELRLSKVSYLDLKGFHRFFIQIPDGPRVVIAPMNIPGAQGQRVWVQAFVFNEPDHDEEFIQSLGHDIEKSGVYNLPPVKKEWAPDDYYFPDWTI